MSSLSENPSSPIFSAGGEGGNFLWGEVAVLETRIELEDVFCPACSPKFFDSKTRFVIEFLISGNTFGGTCIRCGDERVAQFSRTNSEE
jgi:hypothetical protein